MSTHITTSVGEGVDLDLSSLSTGVEVSSVGARGEDLGDGCGKKAGSKDAGGHSDKGRLRDQHVREPTRDRSRARMEADY